MALEVPRRVITRPRLAQRRLRLPRAQPATHRPDVPGVRVARARRQRLPGEVLEVAPERAAHGVAARRVAVSGSDLGGLGIGHERD